LGLLLGYAVAGEALTATLPITKVSQWAMSANVQAWLSNGTEVYDDSLCQDLAAEGSCDPTYVLSLEHAAVYLGVLLAIAVVASLVAFRRRDVP
jgi:disulfide bond formation protein DsbB